MTSNAGIVGFNLPQHRQAIHFGHFTSQTVDHIVFLIVGQRFFPEAAVSTVYLAAQDRLQARKVLRASSRLEYWPCRLSSLDNSSGWRICAIAVCPTSKPCMHSTGV
jgi:hypothetical protein